MTRLRSRAAYVLGAILAAVVVFGLSACGGGGGGGTSETTAVEGHSAAGKTVFTENCATCHTMKDADATGSVGPNLDDLAPDEATVVHQVENGGGAMPAFGDKLSAQQIADVAAYVSAFAGR